MEIDLSIFGDTFKTISPNSFFGAIAIFTPISIIILLIFYKLIKKVKPLWHLIMSFFCSLFLTVIVGIIPIAFMAGLFKIETSKIIISSSILFSGYFIFSIFYLSKIKQFILELPQLKNKK